MSFSITVDGLKYNSGTVLGRGSFGKVFALVAEGVGGCGADKEDACELCIKVPETHRASVKQLQYELRIYRSLQSKSKLQGFAIPLCYGMYTIDNSGMQGLVLEKINGQTLEEIKNDLPLGCVDAKTLMAIAIRLIESISSLHASHICHRDIKPSNVILAGRRLVLLDFGLCKKVVDVNKRHIPQTDKRGLTGTARFCSVFAHEKSETSYRCDVASCLYLLAYLHLGRLPWQGIRLPKSMSAKNKVQRTQARNRMIYESKNKSGIPALFSTKDTVSLREIGRQAQSLGFGEMPPYEHWIQKLSDAFLSV